MSAGKDTSFVEGVHRFLIDPGYVVCRIECSQFYSRQSQNFCGGCKEMDFLLYHPGKKELWLIEVKDYRFDARPKVRELINALCRKVRDTLFLLRTSAICCPEETPLEGISLREFSRLCEGARTVRLAFLMEMGTDKLFPQGTLLANIRTILAGHMKFIDPNLICAPITYPGRIGPWFVTPAHGDVSKRVEVRRKKGRLKEEIAGELRRSQKIEEARETPEAQPPLWKRRLMERENGRKGNHASRRKGE